MYTICTGMQCRPPGPLFRRGCYYSFCPQGSSIFSSCRFCRPRDRHIRAGPEHHAQCSARLHERLHVIGAGLSQRPHIPSSPRLHWQVLVCCYWIEDRLTLIMMNNFAVMFLVDWITSAASMSAGSGLTSLPGAATHVPMPLLATTMVTTWCHSCLSTETETTSCPTRLLDMTMPTCWILVGIQTLTLTPPPINNSCFPVSLKSSFSYLPVGQRFVQEFLTPYLQQAQDIWQWLLGAGILGALVAIVIGILTVLLRKKLKQRQRRKRASSYGERQPLLQSSSEDGSSSYQTTL